MTKNVASENNLALVERTFDLKILSLVHFSNKLSLILQISILAKLFDGFIVADVVVVIIHHMVVEVEHVGHTFRVLVFKLLCSHHLMQVALRKALSNICSSSIRHALPGG